MKLHSFNKSITGSVVIVYVETIGSSLHPLNPRFTSSKIHTLTGHSFLLSHICFSISVTKSICICVSLPQIPMAPIFEKSISNGDTSLYDNPIGYLYSCGNTPYSFSNCSFLRIDGI